MVSMAWMLAFLLRYNFSIQPVGLTAFFDSLPVVVLGQSLVLWKLGLYKGLWRFASIPDLWNILRAVAAGVLAITVLLFLANRVAGVPRATLVLYPVFLALLLGGPRFIYRVWKDHGLSVFSVPGRKRLLIVGAGRAGEMLARDMLRDHNQVPVGFLDDQVRLQGAKVQGIPVVGTIAQLPQVVEERDIDSILIAVPSATNAQMRRIVELCEQTKVPFRTLPRLRDMMNGRSAVKALKDVALEDLLGREPVSLDWQGIRKEFAGKTVLVSGGGGSIGAELCRQIARLGPAALVVFDVCEYNLYEIEMELRGKFPDLHLGIRLGDVRDWQAVDTVMSRYRPDIIFHAAAYKHVPMLEDQAREAVRNNVLGTKTMATAANKYACGTFVLISTDKAVNPTNVMGASKRVAEIYCQNSNQWSTTRFITVRFGNVLGSAGSVVPLFQRQIEEGGPITITHPDMTRYFMTIPEACQLIMQAAVMGRGGEIYVLNMGEPIKITYLAEQMIRLGGKKAGEDIKIVYTGLRPGEKLFEELFHDQENLSHTGHDKILLAQSRKVDWGLVTETVVELEEASAAYDETRVRSLLKILVPELSEAEAHEIEPLELSDDVRNTSTLEVIQETKVPLRVLQ